MADGASTQSSRTSLPWQQLWPWRAMLAVDGVILVLLFIYKFASHDPQIEYAHLLVTYHFGFGKRALMGSMVALLAAQVPIVAVYLIGLAAILIALVLFWIAFKRCVGFDGTALALFAFLAGSPFFFKNFMYTIGYFDIYGCIVALTALIIRVGAFYVPALAAGCVALVLLHPVHLLLYCPVIGFIAVIRWFLPVGFSTGRVLVGAAACLVILAVFVASAQPLRTSPEALLNYLHSRGPDLTEPRVTYLWTSTLADELRSTWGLMRKHALRIPVYIALMLLHAPVGLYFVRLIRSLVIARDRAVVALTLVGITAGYVMIGTFGSDHARWVANWAVCLALLLLATHLLPRAKERAPSIAAGAPGNLVLGWIITAIPRLGLNVPF